MSTPTLVHLLIALLVGICVVAVVRFETACLTDLARIPDTELRWLTRPAWMALIVLSIPIGGMIYMLYGRAR